MALSLEVDGNVDIRIKQLPDGPLERLTFDDVAETDTFWSPDGQFVTYVNNESGNYDVWWRRADGTRAPELLLDDERSLHQVNSALAGREDAPANIPGCARSAVMSLGTLLPPKEWRGSASA